VKLTSDLSWGMNQTGFTNRKPSGSAASACLQFVYLLYKFFFLNCFGLSLYQLPGLVGLISNRTVDKK
jgi:hypothetical protein